MNLSVDAAVREGPEMFQVAARAFTEEGNMQNLGYWPTLRAARLSCSERTTAALQWRHVYNDLWEARSGTGRFEVEFLSVPLAQLSR